MARDRPKWFLWHFFDRLHLDYYGLVGLFCFVFERARAPRRLSLVKGTLWGNCKFLLEHCKGTKAMVRGHGGKKCLCCLHEVSGLVGGGGVYPLRTEVFGDLGVLTERGRLRWSFVYKTQQRPKWDSKIQRIWKTQRSSRFAWWANLCGWVKRVGWMVARINSAKYFPEWKLESVLSARERFLHCTLQYSWWATVSVREVKLKHCILGDSLCTLYGLCTLCVTCML